MDPLLVLLIIGGYFILLITISWLTSKNSTAHSFYDGNRQSPWYLVAFGMIGASLSGVTFISVPGEVGNSNFYYFQMILGYLIGYSIIAQILLPLYYKNNLISIYTYLDKRLGFWSYKSGAFFFLLSRVIGASFRLFLVASVLQLAVFDSYNLPFWFAVVFTVLLIWLYTFKGGIKTIVWTDTLQTTFMLISVLVSIYFIKEDLNWSWSTLTTQVYNDSKSTIFIWDWQHNRNFIKQFFSGAFIAIVMTGLDQDMMQKNLTCRNLEESQKNIYWMSFSLIPVNLLFMILGVLLYQFVELKGIIVPSGTDNLFPYLAIEHFSSIAGIAFLLGITAAAYSSADSALTALTTSFCIDFLNFNLDNFESKKETKLMVHIGFSLVLIGVILFFKLVNDQSVINSIFSLAGYTYGPLLGLFSFGIFTRRIIEDQWVPLICALAPIFCYVLSNHSDILLNGYQFGFELLLLNGTITFIGLWLISKNQSNSFTGSQKKSVKF